jgi:hypothetical protein
MDKNNIFPNDIRKSEINKFVGGIAKKRPIQVATRCAAHHVGTTLAGTTAGVTYRYSHVMKTECHSLQFGFANFYPTVTTESSNGNPITIAVALEYNGLMTRLFFGGVRNKTLDIGGFALTDPIYRDIPVGATFFTRIWVSVPTDGQTYPQGLGLIGSSGEGKSTGDQVNTTGALGASTESGYGPSVIIGVPAKDDAVAFALIGDSMVGDANGDGWPVLEVQNKYGYSILSRPGSDVTTMQQNSGNAYRMRLLQYFTHAIVTFGANDWNLPASFATQEGYIKDLWRNLKSIGLVVYQSTSTPRTTSTDNWATVGNQTVYSGNSYNTKRATFNQNLRAGLYPVNVLDVAAVIETASDSTGLWKAGFTGDGIHPLSAAKDAITASINLGLK